MANFTGNTGAWIDDHVYSDVILRHFEDFMLPMSWSRNVDGFSKGSLLHIKTMGSVTLQEVAENQSITYSPIDTGEITMSISDYVGDGWYFTEELMEEGSQIPALMAGRARESSNALSRFYETRWLSAAQEAQCAGDANAINGVPHRMICNLCDPHKIIDIMETMAYAFDEADVPRNQRIAIIDPSIATQMERLFTTAESINQNYGLDGHIPKGFVQDHRFVRQIAGWSVWTSTRLPVIKEETIDYTHFGGGVQTVTNAVANVFMAIGSDESKPLMHAWRKKVGVQSDWNWHMRRREYQTYAKFGIGVQRVDTLGVVLAPKCTNLACITGDCE